MCDEQSEKERGKWKARSTRSSPCGEQVASTHCQASTRTGEVACRSRSMARHTYVWQRARLVRGASRRVDRIVIPVNGVHDRAAQSSQCVAHGVECVEVLLDCDVRDAPTPVVLYKGNVPRIVPCVPSMVDRSGSVRDFSVSVCHWTARGV
jgi:hypothetical protein